MNPENTLFIRATPPGPPVLLLADTPLHDRLPSVTAPDGSVPLCQGWSLLPKPTVCVVDGPGEAGLMIPAMVAPVLDGTGASEDGMDAMAAWRGDAEQAGGAIVLSLDRMPDVIDWPQLLGSGTARGGFLRLLR
jgi:hypothetical protein